MAHQENQSDNIKQKMIIPVNVGNFFLSFALQFSVM